MRLEYVCRVLDERGNTFALNCFHYGLSLARKVAGDEQRVMSGSTVAFIPSVAAHDQNYPFEHGFIVTSTGGGLPGALADLILAITKKCTSTFIVGESLNSRPADPSLREWSIPMMIAGDDVYPVVRASDATRARLLELIDYLDRLQGSCIFIVEDLPELPDSGRRDVSQEALQRAAVTAKLALIIAYDGDGVVVWSSQPTLADWAVGRYPIVGNETGE